MDKKKLIMGIVALAAILAMSLCMLSSPEETDADSDSGSCGPNLTWTYEDGKLTISGTGEMTEYGSGKAPWYKYKSSTKSLELSKGMSTISAYAFRDFKAITTVDIPDAVTEVGVSAFSDCSALKTISIGKGLKTIPKLMFSGCKQVTEIYYNAPIPTSVASGKFDAPFAYVGSDSSGVRMVFGDDVVTVPANISSYANVTEVVFGSHVETIGKYAFSGKSLKSLEITPTITTIGEEAFEGCDKLKTVTIPDTMTEVGVSAFSDCSALKTISIGNGLKTIPKLMFSGCKQVTEIYYNAPIPTSVASGKFDAPFAYVGSDSSGVRMVFGDDVVTVPANISSYANVTEVVFGSHVETIGKYAFSGKSLKSLEITPVIRTISVQAFRDCDSLETVVIPDNVITIDDEAFNDCSSLKTVKIGTGVKTIGALVFANCGKLSSVEYNAIDAVVNADSKKTPFYQSGKESGAIKVVVGDGVSSLGNRLFSDNYISEIKLGSSLTTIGTHALSYNYLEEVTFGEAVTTFGNYALKNSELKKITFIGHEKLTIGKEAFAVATKGQVDVYSGYEKGFLDNYGSSTATFNYITSHGDMHLVTFVTNCPTSLDPIQVENGYKLTQPSISYSGHTLTGWYTNSTLTKTYDFNSPVKSDLTLYACWKEIKTYTVTFVTNCSTSLDPVKVDEGSKVAQPSISYPGHTLTGWYTNSALTKKYDFNSTVKSNMTLYAGWKEVPTYTVSFVTNCPTSLDPVKVDEGSKVAQPSISYAGHSLIGWFSDAGFTKKYYFNTPVKSDMTLYASWGDPVQYTVTFETNGGSSMSSVKITDGEKILENIPSDPTRSGYDFTGWFTDRLLRHQVTAEDTISGDMTLYAGWNEKEIEPISDSDRMMIECTLIGFALAMVILLLISLFRNRGEYGTMRFSPKTAGIYMIGLAAFSIVFGAILGFLGGHVMGEDETKYMIAFAGAAAIGAVVLLLNGLVWLRGSKNGPRMTSIHYYISVLLMYISSCICGTSLVLIILRSTGKSFVGGDEVLGVLLMGVFAFLGLLTTIVIRQTLRDYDTIEEMDLDDDKVYKHTGILRIILAAILPILIILAIILIIGYFMLQVAATSMTDSWTCPVCGAGCSGGNVCWKCGHHR